MCIRDRYQRRVRGAANGHSATQPAHRPNSMAVLESPQSSNDIFGYDINLLPPQSKLPVVAGGALVSAIMFAWLQEMVFEVPGFKFGGFMSLLTSLTFVTCAAVELASKERLTERKGDLKDYLILSLCTAGGIYFTNWSLTYINYPMRVMFKSSKLLPVMVMGLVIAKRKHTKQEYGCAALLVAGIICFAMADARGSPKFDSRGMIIISVGVILDAITSNFEEKRFFREKDCLHAEVILYSFAIGSVWTAITITTTGELYNALAHAATHPEVYWMTFGFSMMGYMSIVFVLLLIKLFNASVAEAVKSIRKITTIVISFAFFQKPVTGLHAFGFLLFCASVGVGMQSKLAKQDAPQNDEAATLVKAETVEEDGGVLEQVLANVGLVEDEKDVEV
eukprot:TRINITY_DN10614_c0_g1_i1.p1 TRINITY_DN10614_c0_g1~~TRINITY_DN10614_c0_g1_i1.p1  ORF type:complete len:393 (+),score=113.05 TRINITY_DN10614_c0_g1_i1:144-1322(+)